MHRANRFDVRLPHGTSRTPKKDLSFSSCLQGTRGGPDETCTRDLCHAKADPCVRSCLLAFKNSYKLANWWEVILLRTYPNFPALVCYWCTNMRGR